MEEQKEADIGIHPDSLIAVDVTMPAGENKEGSVANSKIEIDEMEHTYITGYKLAIVVASVTLVSFLVLLDTSIIATAIPRITTDFHSLADVGWYGSSYLLASAPIQPLTGKLYSYFCSKYTFLTFFAIFELGSLICGVATSSKMLIVGRAIAGMGSSGLMNGALTIVSACVPLEKRALYIGGTFSVAQIGLVVGPLIGGALTEYASWRWCFYINLPPGGLIGILLFLIHIPDRTATDQYELPLRKKLGNLDLLGFTLFAPVAIQLLLALQWGGSSYRWDSSTIIGLFCGAAGTAGIFLAWEYRQGDAAMLPFAMVRKRVVWASTLATFFFFGNNLIISYYLPIYFQAVRGTSPTLSGVNMLPIIISQILFAGVSGALVGKLGYYLPWSIASAILMAVGAGLISMFNPETSTGTWIGFEIITGMGRGCGFQMPIIAIQNALSRDQLSVGMAVMIVGQTFGGAFFLAFAELVFSNGLISAIPFFAPGVNAQAVINAGASAIRSVVPPGSLAGVLLAYNQAVSHVLYLAAGAAVATFVFSSGMGWKKVKKSTGAVSDA